MSSSSSDKKYFTSRWSCLPRDLLSQIAKRLLSRLDVLRFRSVCSEWRQSIALPQSLKASLRLPFPITPNNYVNLNRRGHFVISERISYSIAPMEEIAEAAEEARKVWLVKLKEKLEGIFRVSHPLSFTGFGHEPVLVWKALGLLDCRITEVLTSYELVYCDTSGSEISELQCYEMGSVIVRKVAICDRGENGFSVIGIHKGALVVWRKGDDKWTILCDDQRGYDDVVCHNGKFYVTSAIGRIHAVHPFNLTVVEVAHRVIVDYLVYYGHLVKSCEDLFLVVGNCYSSFRVRHPRLTIFKLDEENHTWIRVNNLGEIAFFIGHDGSFALSARDFPGCKENCVYFRGAPLLSLSQFGRRHTCILDLRDGTSRPLEALPRYFKIFWPPPTWIKSLSSSSLSWICGGHIPPV